MAVFILLLCAAFLAIVFFGRAVFSPTPNQDSMKDGSRRSLLRAAALLGAKILLPQFGVSQSKPRRDSLPVPATTLPPAIKFEDIAQKAGVHFVTENCSTPQKHQPETMPAGVALFDYDGDGLLDIYLVNGAEMPSLVKTEPKYYNRLFHNNGDGTFTDVSERAGVTGAGYGMGVAVGDYDNDGWPDLFVANVNGNQLYHNNGDGTFTDVTAKAGLSGAMYGGARCGPLRPDGSTTTTTVCWTFLWRITASGIHATNLSAWAWMAAATVTPEASLPFPIRYIATMETAHSLMFRRRLEFHPYWARAWALLLPITMGMVFLTFL